MTQTDKQAHTQTPWALSEGYTTAFVQTATNPARHIAEVVDWPHDNRDASINGRRIVAAVNFAEGVSTEWLESHRLSEVVDVDTLETAR